jgi:hypothetical protein
MYRVVRDLRLQTHEVVHGVAGETGGAHRSSQLPAQRCPVFQERRTGATS